MTHSLGKLEGKYLALRCSEHIKYLYIPYNKFHKEDIVFSMLYYEVTHSVEGN